MLKLEDLAAIAGSAPDVLRAPVAQFEIGGLPFRFGEEPYLMGVINLSADSWYRESVCLSAQAAVERAQVLRAQGAHLIDVGAESSLAHAARVDEAMQTSRLVPVVRDLVQLGIRCSVETYHPAVTRACLEAGATVLNLTGTVATESLYRMVAEHGAAVIVCYVAGNNVREVGDFDLRGDPMDRLYEYFARQVELAARCGVTRILVDPGLGFYYRNLADSAVRVAHQLRVFLNTFRLRRLGYPVCNALPHAFEYFREDVRCAEPFFATLAALGRTDLYRTHEVSRTRAVLAALAAWDEGR